MTSFIERADELRHLLGDVSGRQLCRSLGIAETAYSQWSRGQVPERDTLVALRRRYQVSIDSLLGLDDTERLEPTPSLRKAQLLLADEVAGLLGSPESEGQRLVLAWKILSEGVPGFTLEAWAEYLRTDLGGWLTIEKGLAKPSRDHLAGAAHVLGWYEVRDAWLYWLTTGAPDLLIAPNQEAIQKAMIRHNRMGIGMVNYAATEEQILKDRNPRAPENK